MMKTAADALCLDAPKKPRAVVSESVRALLQSLSLYRCRLIHNSISHPVNGKYRCWRCLREFETGW